MKPIVSIVIPVFNGENYLRQAIDSALSQTYNPLEIIVVNDGSNDKTEEIALSYGDKIRYFAKENGGVSTALNTGITNMRGEYFSWLSHDDLYAPEKIELEIAAISNNTTTIVYSDYSVIDSNGAIISIMDIAKKYPDAPLTFGLFPILRQVLNGCSLLIHKSHFTRVGLFNEHLRVTQDYDLWFKMLRGMELAYVNKPLVMSREHGSQVTHNYERNRAESDELWLNMLKSITPKETCRLDGMEHAFWDKQTEFLHYTPYKNAKAYAKSRLKALGGSTISPSKLIRRIAYKSLSGISRLTRIFGIQKVIKKNKVFNWGYKIWFKVRYR
jgi:glycosyltransferase involved in cell wall biosynthesis